MTPTFDFSSDGFVDPDEAVARNRDFQIDLFTDALGLDVVGKLGEGKQGACYLLGNGNVFKVSSSYSEGVLAYAQSQIGLHALPQILNVYSIDYEEHTFIGFEREEADDVMPRGSNDQNAAFLMMDRAFKFMRRSALNIQETYPEEDVAMSLQLANQMNPALITELDDLVRDVQEMRSKTKHPDHRCAIREPRTNKRWTSGCARLRYQQPN